MLSRQSKNSLMKLHNYSIYRKTRPVQTGRVFLYKVMFLNDYVYKNGPRPSILSKHSRETKTTKVRVEGCNALR